MVPNSGECEWCSDSVQLLELNSGFCIVFFFMTNTAVVALSEIALRYNTFVNKSVTVDLADVLAQTADRI